MSRLASGIALIMAGVVAQAASVPVRGTVDARIRTALYDPQQVYRLEAFVGYQIELVFEKGERLRDREVAISRRLP